MQGKYIPYDKLTGEALREHPVYIERNTSLQTEINKHRMSLDKEVHIKTLLEKKALKKAVNEFKGNSKSDQDEMVERIVSTKYPRFNIILFIT